MAGQPGLGLPQAAGAQQMTPPPAQLQAQQAAQAAQHQQMLQQQSMPNLGTMGLMIPTTIPIGEPGRWTTPPSGTVRSPFPVAGLTPSASAYGPNLQFLKKMFSFGAS